MSVFRNTGRRCDWCGKFSMHEHGEYTKPDGKSAGYINRPCWETDEHGNDVVPDTGDDICEECEGGFCVCCGSDCLIRITPPAPGPDGWGWRCAKCNHRWYFADPIQSSPASPPLPGVSRD